MHAIREFLFSRWFESPLYSSFSVSVLLYFSVLLQSYSFSVFLFSLNLLFIFPFQFQSYFIFQSCYSLTPFQSSFSVSVFHYQIEPWKIETVSPPSANDEIKATSFREISALIIQAPKCYHHEYWVLKTWQLIERGFVPDVSKFKCIHEMHRYDITYTGMLFIYHI